MLPLVLPRLLYLKFERLKRSGSNFAPFLTKKKPYQSKLQKRTLCQPRVAMESPHFLSLSNTFENSKTTTSSPSLSAAVEKKHRVTESQNVSEVKCFIMTSSRTAIFFSFLHPAKILKICQTEKLLSSKIPNYPHL